MTKNLEVLINAYKEAKKKNINIDLGKYLESGNVEEFSFSNETYNMISKLDYVDTVCDVKLSVLKSLIYSIDHKNEIKNEEPTIIQVLKNSITQLNDIDSSLMSSICFFDSDSVIQIIEKDYDIGNVTGEVFSGKYDYSDMLKIRLLDMEIKKLESEKEKNNVNYVNKKVI